VERIAVDVQFLAISINNWGLRRRRRRRRRLVLPYKRERVVSHNRSV
jgi:hypothetical protein